MRPRRRWLPVAPAAAPGHLAAGGRPPRAPPAPGGLFGVYSMNPFRWLIHTLIWIYIYLLIGAAVLSWLIAFNVVNSHNPTVRMIWDFLYPVTEPGLRPIRSVLPNLGGIDISPVILIIALMFLDQ